MSYQIDSIVPRIEEVDLPHRHLEVSDWHNESIDLVTIGDSFSNAMGSGKNPYYQDYLASTLHINILNIQNIDNRLSYIDTIRYLLKNGWLKHVHPKAVLIECVTREAFNHLPETNTSISISADKLSSALSITNFTREFPHPMLINMANYKAPYYYIKYKYSIHAKKEIYKFPLIKNFFSTKDSNHLLIYHDDINSIEKVTESSVSLLNAQLNILSSELTKEGITLIFMPAVDKYDLYYNYVSNRKNYPLNPFFSFLRKEPKQYLFVDTKSILDSLLEQNIRDVFYADDTHWSYLSSELIASDPTFSFLLSKEKY